MEIDTLVIVKEDNVPALNWKLGRIINVHPGPDGVIRTAAVRTIAGLFKRPVVKLCVLPVNELITTSAKA